MPATDALLARTDFAEAGVMAIGRAHLERMADAFREDDDSGALGVRDSSELVDGWLRSTAAAETFYVHPLMRDVVTAAASSMPDEALLPEDLPSPHGFVLIPGGVGQINQYGRRLMINAVLWSTFGTKVQLLFLTDKYDLNDFYNAEAVSADGADAFDGLPRYMPSSLMGIALSEILPRRETFASTLPPEIHTEQRDNDDGTYSIHLLREDGSPAHEDDVPDLDFGFYPDPVVRWLVAMWRLMQQSLATTEVEEPTRQIRRQLERRNVTDRRVTVIALRRKTPRGSGEREVEWSHRWIRRGHWRQQPYKDAGEWTTRAIWIHPTICGPDDKPLLVRDHVYSLKR